MSQSRTLVVFGIIMLCLIQVVSLHAQATQSSIKIFAPVFINNSLQGGRSSYGTNTLNLSCPAQGVTAVVSSSPDGTGFVFEDNLLNLTSAAAPGAGVNICRGGDTNFPGNATATNCFQQPYESAVTNYIGQNPDTAVFGSGGPGSFLQQYGVPPIDVSSLIGTGNVQFDLIDYGGFLGSSSLYLVSNCTQNGVVSGGTITGNPIPTTNPDGALTQTFPFDSTNGQLLIFTADFSKAFDANTLSIVNNSVPAVTDHAISQTDFATLVAGTSLAPSVCIPHTGELDASGNPMCKMYTIKCTNDTTSIPTGDNCPFSTKRNLYFQDKFDTEASIIGALPTGTGFGFLMGSDGWTSAGLPCVFVSREAGTLCPQNTLTAFLGDYAAGGTPRGLNSTFVGVSGVPLPVTAVTVSPVTSFGWTNSQTPTISFISNPATFTGANANGFVPAPILSLTYGIAPSSDPPLDTTFPIGTDLTNSNTIPCPSAPDATKALPFPSTAILDTLADGQYSLHYFATDCAGTEELLFSVQPGNDGNWASFKVQPIKVDTTSPTATFSSPLASTYTLNQTVNASFNCTDTGSGLSVCGPNSGQVLGSGSLGTSPVTGSLQVPTSSPGSKTVSLYAQDLAGNTGSTSASYTVGYVASGLCDGDAGHQILQPINADGSSVFKQGRSVPAKFRVCDANGNSIGTAGVVKSLTLQTRAGTVSLSGDETGDDADDSIFRWDPTNQLWIRNISTKKLARNMTYIFTITLNDNSTIAFQFGLR